MIREDEEALICDLAETYGIYDYRSFSPEIIAVYAKGLREDSRIKMSISGQRAKVDTLLLAGINDRLSLLLWGNTKDAKRGVNKPKMITDSLLVKEKDVTVFSSGEDFEKARTSYLT